MKTPASFSIFLLLASFQSLNAQSSIQSLYYPMHVGDRWTYRVLDLKSSNAKMDTKKKVVVEVERQENFTRKIPNDPKGNSETRIGYILKSTSGGKTTRDHVVVLEDGVHRIHAADTPISPPLLFFKHPLAKGEKWECNSTSGNTTIKGTFTWRNDRVTLPVGMVDAVLVSFTNGLEDVNRVEIDYWFVAKVGMVKQRVLERNREIALELESYVPAKAIK